jgi:hypothetical protein
MADKGWGVVGAGTAPAMAAPMRATPPAGKYPPAIDDPHPLRSSSRLVAFRRGRAAKATRDGSPAGSLLGGENYRHWIVTEY